MQFPTFKIELEKLSQGYNFIAGCDEVGVGPIAGPVVAAACILDPEKIGKYRSKNKWYFRVRDSKTTYEHERETLCDEIKDNCLFFGIGQASSSEIDQLNIHQASLLAMQRAVQQMVSQFDSTANRMCLFVDGRFVIKSLKNSFIEQHSLIDGDALMLTISAASIIAKVYRDAILKQMDLSYPQFGFARHKGYNTKEHQQALQRYGLIDQHRRSFLKNFKSNQPVLI